MWRRKRSLSTSGCNRLRASLSRRDYRAVRRAPIAKDGNGGAINDAFVMVLQSLFLKLRGVSLEPEQGVVESLPARLIGCDEQPALDIGYAVWRTVQPAHVAASLLHD